MMKRRLVVIFLSCAIHCSAQNYKHIGVENGLSSRKVYYIQKDNTGYMWFLTHEGLDRYDGKEFKHYNLRHGSKDVSSLQDIGWLYSDHNGGLWQIDKRGRVFKYNQLLDTFEMIYQLPAKEKKENATPISYSFIDRNDVVWLCCNDVVYLFNLRNNNIINIQNDLGDTITSITQVDDTHFFIGTESGLCYVELHDDSFKRISCKAIDELSIQITKLHFDRSTRKLIIGSFQKGAYIFDLKTGKCTQLPGIEGNITISCLKPKSSQELLIGTTGSGAYVLNLQTLETTPYIIADFDEANAIAENDIDDIYIDEEERVWMANFPLGVSVRDDRYTKFQWFRHFTGDQQSLVNDRVNGIIEDSEGDLWFATYNGISLYLKKEKRWVPFLSAFNQTSKGDNHIFLSVCEAKPGVIYAGGYSSAIYRIDKKSLTASILPVSSYKSVPFRPDKYIRMIKKDSQGGVWVGGYYNLKRIDEANKEIRLYPELNNITAIIEKDHRYMWIGSAKGLFLLDKETGVSKKLITPVEPAYVYSLCQTYNNKLYIGTSGSGLLVYDYENEKFSHFHKGNSALLSNNIHTMLCDEHNNIIFSSENGLTRLIVKDFDFLNWTKEQGLPASHFSPNSGAICQNNKYIFGGTEGAIEFDKEMQLPRDCKPKLVLSDFKIFYESVYPGMKNSPLEKDIDKTSAVELSYDQNIFSLKVSSINYDNPSNILYSWKLEGFYDSWSKLNHENSIHFTNLSPGEYTLFIRAISNENRQIIEERSIDIIIDQPFWQSTWAIMTYLALIALAGIALFRLIYMRKERRNTKDKFQFFINTAHDIRTPLTLVKAPLEEIQEKEILSEPGNKNMNIAIHNVNVLLRMTNNLINFERMNLNSSDLYIAEYELDSFLSEIVMSFRSLAQVKNIQLSYDSNFRFLTVWFDKEKMESVFKNLISNSLKYTPEGGMVHVYAAESANNWSVEITDTGIGIPANEQKKVFKTHFRGSNVANSKISGSGIGMMLVGRQVGYHKGKITLNSVEHKGTTVHITFPKGYEHFNKAHLSFSTPETPPANDEVLAPVYSHTAASGKHCGCYRILIVEDNDGLRSYLADTLSDEYEVKTCENGKEALEVIKEYIPDLIISDIMMPEMRGDEMCRILKNDIETSHIPIILLTALNDEKHIVKGIRTGADEYIIKPFNINILKATVSNMLANRAILRAKFASLDIETAEEEVYTNEIDQKFIADLKTHTENNLGNQQFNVDTLASCMNMSRTSLYKKVKALTDLSPSDYIRNIRLTKASEWLKEGRYNVTEVAEKTGFNDAKYFREVFKRQFNVSPSKYK